MRYIGKTKEIQYFVAEVLYGTSTSNFDLSSPDPVKGYSRAGFKLHCNLELHSKMIHASFTWNKQEGQEALNRSPEYTDQKSNI